MRKQKVRWNQNDVFGIPLLNGNYAIGHILDQRLPNTVRIAVYNESINSLENINLLSLINDHNLISLIEVTREQLDYGVWKILGNKQTNIPIEKYPNEEFRPNKWINSITRDAALAEDFINSYYGLLPWDNWYKSDYLDGFLISVDKKPNNLLYKKDISEG